MSYRDPKAPTSVQYKPGLLTALKNSDVVMTVESVSESSNKVNCIWFSPGTNRELIRANFPPEMLIGAGKKLVFENGVFTHALKE